VTGILSRIRGLATENLNLKVLSVLLAILIHLVVRRDNVREFAFPVPFAMQNVQEGWVFVGDLPDHIQVSVRGRWSGIRELVAGKSQRIVANLKDYRDGERYVLDHRVVQQQLVAAGVEVLAVQPSAIDVKLERLARREVPVQVSTTGEPMYGFGVGPNGLKITPRVVEVIGPARAVRKVRYVRAAPIDLTGADSDLRVRSRLLGVAGDHIKLSVEEVEVAIKLDEREIKRTLPPRSIVVRGCPDGNRCLLNPSEARLTVRGLVRTVNAFLEKVPDNVIFADVAPAIARKERRIRLHTPTVKGLRLGVSPHIAKFQLLGEIPAK
jgi:YbbR domain-containing protein